MHLSIISSQLHLTRTSTRISVLSEHLLGFQKHCLQPTLTEDLSWFCNYRCKKQAVSLQGSYSEIYEQKSEYHVPSCYLIHYSSVTNSIISCSEKILSQLQPIIRLPYGLKNAHDGAFHNNKEMDYLQGTGAGLTFLCP